MPHRADPRSIIGVPVGLPCVTTTTLAVGAAYLARREAICQKLTAIEALAGCDVLCSDKTGTLTANKLSIHEPFVPEGVDINVRWPRSADLTCPVDDGRGRARVVAQHQVA